MRHCPVCLLPISDNDRHIDCLLAEQKRQRHYAIRISGDMVWVEEIIATDEHGRLISTEVELNYSKNIPDPDRRQEYTTNIHNFLIGQGHRVAIVQGDDQGRRTSDDLQTVDLSNISRLED